MYKKGLNKYIYIYSMDKTKIKICKKCFLEESELCVFDYHRAVCKRCRYLAKVNTSYFKNYYDNNRVRILELKAISYQKKKNLLIL